MMMGRDTFYGITPPEMKHLKENCWVKMKYQKENCRLPFKNLVVAFKEVNFLFGNLVDKCKLLNIPNILVYATLIR